MIFTLFESLFTSVVGFLTNDLHQLMMVLGGVSPWERDWTFTLAGFGVGLFIIGILVGWVLGRRPSQHQTLSLLQTLIHEMQVGILVFNPQLQLVLNNVAATYLLGIEESDPKMNPFQGVGELLREDRTPYTPETLPLAQAFTTKRPVRNAIVGIQKPVNDQRLSSTPRSITWLLVNATPLLTPDGRIDRIICTISDISECKRTETELRQTQAFLNSIIENLPVGVFVKELPELRFVTWNQAYEALSGIPKEHVLGKNDYDLFPPEQADFFTTVDREVLASGHLAEIPDEPMITPQRGLRLLQTKKVPIFNESGHLVYLLGISEDITERKQAEKELIFEHKRSQLLTEITQKIRQSLQFEEIVQTTVREVLQLLAADRVLIYRLENDGSGEVVTEAVQSHCPAILGEKITDPCFRDHYIERYRNGRVRAISDIDNSDVQRCHTELLQRFQVKANLVVPILQGEQLWGLLIAHQCTSTRDWTKFEIELLQQIANQLSVALAQAEAMKHVSLLLAEKTRTAEQLAAKNLALEEALKNLKQAQTQLIQSEKMASLGQLVAGIAHEINNPVSFIYGNITPANQYATELLDLLHCYESCYPQPVIEVQQKREEIDIDFLSQDFPKLLSSMQEGAKRIREIVRSLQNFSRLDEAEKKCVDLHKGLESTLLILNSRLHKKGSWPGVEIIKEYGDLPLVECLPRQLNQVFMNLLSNAIDALEDKLEHERSSQMCLSGQLCPVKTLSEIQPATVEYLAAKSLESRQIYASPAHSPPRLQKVELQVRASSAQESKKQVGASFSPTIWIRTDFLENNTVRIKIIDNGPGIPPEIQQRLFDPFFTTKPVGKGTGLGLSISYQIVVNQHEGQLECCSRMGEGTEFTITLPLQQKE